MESRMKGAVIKKKKKKNKQKQNETDRQEMIDWAGWEWRWW